MSGTSRNILLVLSMPPPYGGGEIRNAHLNRFFAGNPSYHVFDISNPAGSKETQGVQSLANYLHGILVLTRFAGAYWRTRPGVVYIGLPKTFAAFMRNAAIILWCRILGARVLGDLAGQTFYFLEQGGWRRRLGLFVLRRVSLIKVLGESIRDMLERDYGLTNTRVIDNGVEIGPREGVRRPRTLPRDGIGVLHVGVLNQTKGIRPILLSVKELAGRFPGIRFTFLGEWGDRGLESWAGQHVAEAGIAGHVSFVGLVTGAAKWEHFARADVYLHPSLLDGQPLSILEAMGMGLPVIASRTGAIPDTVIQGRNGILLDAVDTQRICAAFAALLDDPELYGRISANNLEDFARRFTVDGFCRNIQAALEELRDR